MDTLLDIRLSITKQIEPGLCISAYFKLTKSLSGWHRDNLSKLRSLLESKIQLEITLEESNRRSRTCLNLGNNQNLSLYCEQQMKSVSRQNKEATKIHMGFCWTEAN